MRETIKQFTYWEFVYNRKNHHKIQFEKALKFIDFSDIFIYDYTNQSVILKVRPQITFTKFALILEKTNLCPIKDVSSFAKVARGQKRKY